jgi:hypothetical protein
MIATGSEVTPFPGVASQSFAQNFQTDFYARVYCIQNDENDGSEQNY